MRPFDDESVMDKFVRGWLIQQDVEREMAKSNWMFMRLPRRGQFTSYTKINKGRSK